MPNTIWRKNFRASIRAFFEREDLPESPGNKTRRVTFLPHKMPWAGEQPTPRSMTAAASMTGEEPAFRDSVFEILLSSHDLVENARALARNAGYHVVVDNSCDDWDYADAARYLLERFHALRARQKRFCLISVGEVTVTLNRTPGAGGRNQQFALTCALELANHPGERLTVLSAGSDGIDGNTQSPAPSPTPPPWSAPAHSALTPSNRLLSSMPVPSLLPLATPWSPAPRARTCATCAC